MKTGYQWCLPWPHRSVRTTLAVAIGAAWALPVGIWIGLSPKWSSRLQPIIQVVASFPAPMLFPLVTMALIFLHVPFTGGCIALMLLGAQWYILFKRGSRRSGHPCQDLQEVASVYRMSRWEVWTKLYLPCTFPYLLTGLITAAGGAWNATIVSEFVQMKQKTYSAFGLGSTISKATTNANYSLLAAGVVTMAFFVVLINRFFWKHTCYPIGRKQVQPECLRTPVTSSPSTDFVRRDLRSPQHQRGVQRRPAMLEDVSLAVNSNEQ